MATWNSDNDSGVFISVIGIIGFVMFAVYFATLTDNRVKHNEVKINNAEEIHTSTNKIAALKEDYTKKKIMLDTVMKNASQRDLQLNELNLTIAKNSEKIAELRPQIPQLKDEISTVSESLQNYKNRYRRQIWGAAVGEKHHSLLLTNGKTFNQLTIKKVSPVGIEISYNDGSARIDYTALPQEWRERFQWDDAEREKKLATERELQQRHNKHVQATLIPPKNYPLSRRTNMPTPAMARFEYHRTREEYMTARSTLNLFMFTMASNTQMNNEGEERTKNLAKLQQLETSSHTALNAYQDARKTLTKVSPSDPLLQLRAGDEK